jgi:hypothetical protein
LVTPTCYVSGVSGAAGACSSSSGAYASGFGYMATTGAALTPRTGQIVARFRF